MILLDTFHMLQMDFKDIILNTDDSQTQYNDFLLITTATKSYNRFSSNAIKKNWLQLSFILSSYFTNTSVQR